MSLTAGRPCPSRAVALPLRRSNDDDYADDKDDDYGDDEILTMTTLLMMAMMTNPSLQPMYEMTLKLTLLTLLTLPTLLTPRLCGH